MIVLAPLRPRVVPGDRVADPAEHGARRRHGDVRHAQAEVLLEVGVFRRDDRLAELRRDRFVGDDHAALGGELADHLAVRAVDARDGARRVVVERGNLRQVAGEREEHAADRPEDRREHEEDDEARVFGESNDVSGHLRFRLTTADCQRPPRRDRRRLDDGAAAPPIDGRRSQSAIVQSGDAAAARCGALTALPPLGARFGAARSGARSGARPSARRGARSRRPARLGCAGAGALGPGRAAAALAAADCAVVPRPGTPDARCRAARLVRWARLLRLSGRLGRSACAGSDRVDRPRSDRRSIRACRSRGRLGNRPRIGAVAGRRLPARVRVAARRRRTAAAAASAARSASGRSRRRDSRSAASPPDRWRRDVASSVRAPCRAVGAAVRRRPRWSRAIPRLATRRRGVSLDAGPADRRRVARRPRCRARSRARTAASRTAAAAR